MPVDIRLLYVTCSSMVEAEAIAAALVQEHLAACCNLLPGMRSCFVWEGAVQIEHEVVLIAKTQAAHEARATERIRALHSYEVPCIISVPVSGGHQPFLDWIATETASPAPGSSTGSASAAERNGDA